MSVLANILISHQMMTQNPHYISRPLMMYTSVDIPIDGMPLRKEI